VRWRVLGDDNSDELLVACMQGGTKIFKVDTGTSGQVSGGTCLWQVTSSSRIADLGKGKEGNECTVSEDDSASLLVYGVDWVGEPWSQGNSSTSRDAGVDSLAQIVVDCDFYSNEIRLWSVPVECG